MNKGLSRRLAVTLGAILALGLSASVSMAQLATFCAEVKLEILQEATLEREAFDASLKVNNNLPDSPLTDLRVNVFVKDEQGNPADDVFFIKIATLTNTNAIDGSGVVQSSTTAEIRWLIIPSTGAGGILPGGKRYSVKATINGVSAGAAQSVTTFDDFITVYPQPSLKLEYVLPYEVFGDEPLTTGIEPIEPFPLGVRVTNIGYGTAKNFKIESAQPKIIDNKQALPVDFKLLGTVVGGTTIPDTLLVPFGDIPAQGVGQASWIMTTSLSGRFVEFTSTFTHAAELGGQLTSLIQSVTTYTLLRDVLVDQPGRDATPDFLVNASMDRGAMQALLDAGGQPNAELILESDQAAPLAVTEVPSTLSGTLGGSNATLTMTFSQGVSSNIWIHSSVPFNKTPGLVLQSARASDGRTLAAKNVWLSKHFKKDDLTVNYRLNILDLTSGASTYSINFDPAALDAAPGGVTDLVAMTTAEGGTVNLTWSAPGEDGYTGHILGGRYMIENKIDLSTPFAPAFAQVNFATSTDPGDAESYALGGLVGNATTYLSLWTQDTGGGISEISNSATAYTLPYSPRDLVLTAVSSVSAHAAWQGGNNYPPIEYLVFAATAAGGVAVSSSPYQDSFEREFTFADLAPSTTYTVFGVARNTETLVMSAVAALGQFMTSPSPDTTPPITSLLVNGVTVSTAALVVTSTDTLGFIATDSESGVAQTLYALDGGTETVYVSTFSLAYGTYTLTYRSEDLAGNFEALQASSITSIAALYSTDSGDGAASVSSPRADATITAVSTDTAASAYAVAVSSQGLIPATSSFYELLPSSVVFDPPALLSLRFSPVALDTATAAIYRFDGVAWDSAPVSGQQITDIGGGLLEISGSLQSASLYAVFALPPTLVSIEVTPSTASIAMGTTAQFEATGTFTDASTRTLTGEVAWSTDVSSTVAVSTTGVATGLLEGTALIIASSGTITAQAVLTVTPATLVSIEVAPSTASIAMGTTIQFEATGTFTDASTRTLTGEVAWSTDVSSTVAVSTTGAATGLLEGTAAIIASSGAVTAQAVLTVTPAALVSIEVTPSTASIAMGTTIQFEATGIFTDASTRTLTGEVAWSTDVSSTVAVSTTGAATGLLEGTAAIIASSGAVTAQAVLTVTPAALVSIEVTPSTVSIAMGTTMQFEATGTFTDASTRTLTGELAWSTDVSSVATVASGLAIGVGEGTALVIASSGAVTAQADLTVTPATLVSIAVTPPSASISAGLTAQFEATGTFTDASTRTLTGEVAWTTDLSTVASVDVSGLATGLIEGTAQVSASSGSISAFAELMVTAPTLVSINVAPSSATIAAGLTTQFEATGTFTDLSTRALTSEVAWTTDLSTVATIEANGLATGLIEGTVQVSASSGTITAFAELTVTAPTLVSIAVTPASASIAAGLTAQFEAAGTFTDGSTRTLTGEVAWTTDLSTVATINTAGLATGLVEGTALAIASSGTITAQAVLTVTPATLVSIAVTPPSASIAAGLTAQFEAAGTFTDGSTRTLTGEVAWSTDVSSVATISTSGLAAGVGEGTALVIASSGTITAQAVLTVTPATLVSIEVTPPSASIAAGLTAQFEAAGTFTDASTRTLTGEVAWSTYASSVAMVSAAGLAMGVGEGTALVIASSGTITGQAVLTVTPATLVSIEVTPPSASIAAGLTAQFEAAGTFTDGSTRTLTGEVAWSTDLSTVATVNASGLATGVGEGSAFVIASSGTITAQVVLTVTPATLVSIAVAPPSASIAAGLTAQFEAAGTFTDGSTRTLTGEVSWSTDLSSVATVSASGLATGVGEGSALVIASSGTITTQAVLTVTPSTLVSITVTPASASITAGMTAQFTTAGTFTDGSTRTLTSELAWSTDASSVATVNASGLATGVGEGTTLVIASSGTISAQAVLTVTPATLVSIEVTPPSASIAAGMTAQFEATASFTDGSTRTLTGEVAWSTDVSSVATVNASGLATGVGEGVALVIASSGTITAQAVLTVTPPTLISLAVTPTPASISAGLTAQFEAAGTFTDGSTRTLTGEVAWSTDASSVATVSASGLAAGVGEGTALVIASSGTITAQAVLTVTPATLISIAVTPPSVSISAGLTAQFEATGTFTDASTRTLTGEVAWSTDPSTVATINAAGLATGVGEGTALVIASSGAIASQASLTVNATYFTTASADGAATLSSSRADMTITAVSPGSVASADVAAAGQGLVLMMSSYYELQPSPVVFDPAALLSFNFDPASVDTRTISIYRYDGPEWSSAPVAGQSLEISEPSLARISGYLSGTSLYAVFALPAAPALVSIEVTPASVSIRAGQTAQFEAAGTFTDGSTRTLTGEVVWTTDVSSVATVDASGLATGVAAGATRVIASSGAVAGHGDLTVTAPFLAGLKGYWKMDEAGGTTLVDELGSANAALTGGRTTGVRGGGIAPDAVGSIAVDPVDLNTQAWTIMGWFRIDAARGDTGGPLWGNLYDGYTFYDPIGWTICHVAQNSAMLDTNQGGFYVTSPAAAGLTVADGAWHHAAQVYGGGVLKLYVDGVYLGGENRPATLGARSRLNFGNGGPRQGGYGKFVGDLDEFAVLDRALSQTELLAVKAQVTLSTAASSPTLAAITVTPSTASISAGTTAQFTAAGAFTDLSTRTLTGEVVWTTNLSTVATVDANGLATGVGEGPALVIASSGTFTAQAVLTVTPPTLVSITVTPTSAMIAAGLTAQFEAAGTFTDGSTRTLTGEVAWSTDASSVATVSASGLAAGVGEGTALVIASSGTFTAQAVLTVVPPALVSIEVTPASASILAGQTAQFEAAGTFSDASTRTLTSEVAWSTDVSSVATTSALGLVTGVGGGTARVIASYGAITGFATLTVTLPPLTLASITPSAATVGQVISAALTGTGFNAATALTLERADALSGTWAAKGSFAQGRYLGTLTKLGDGRVLLAGGVGGPTAADIYNPATGAWTAAPALNQGRDQHAAVALADGRVLVSGGYASGAPVNSAEIYNPALNTWTTVASMNAVRAWHQMTLLADGRVLAAGGTNGPGYLNSTEIYDPAADTWTPAASMSVGHSGAAMATLGAGKILVAGGFGGNLTGEVYDPAANAWTTATGALQASGYYLQAVTLPNGKVVIAGDPGGTTDLYDPATNALTPAATLGTARYVHAMARVDGTALVIGGENSTALASTEFYDAAAGVWRPGPALTAPRTWLRGAVLEDGRVLVAGGLASVGGTRLNTAELLGEPAVTIAATGVSAADSQHLTGTLDLSGAATGYWDVIVRRTDGQIARLEDGFQISTAPAQTDFDAPIVTLSFSTPTFTASSGLVTIGTHSLISLHAVDPSSSSPASGVAQILYAVDATTPNVTYTAPFTLAAGAHTVYFSATDVAGNTSEISSATLSAAESPFVGVFSPSSGAIGIAYSMAGFGFGAYGGANTQVRFGPSTSPVSVWNDASIVGTVPGLSTGAHTVTLERWAGSTVTITAAGTYTVTPLVPTLSVATGPIGLPFTLTGPGFGTFSGANSRVLFAGATAPVSVWNDATISGTIPGVADGTTTVVVERQTADGFVARSEPLPFTVTVPSVTSVVPSSAPIGAGFTLTGWSFGNFAGTNTQVLIGGATTPVSVWNDTTIVGTVPGALRPGEHELVVERRTADGFSARSASVPFTVEGLWLEAVSPSTGAIGIPFTLTGTGFGSYLGANSRVMFGVSTAAVSVWNNTTISGTVPTLATGAYAVTVERQQGTDVSVSNASTFTVISPEIASVTPSSGPIGTVFTLSGTGFGPFAGVNTFLLLDGATTPISVWNDSTITATVPGGLTTGVKELTAVRRNADGGLSASNTINFEVTGMSIASINPSTGPIGIPFTIKGSQFGVFLGANSRVRFGVSTAAVSVWNDTTISGILPALSTGAHAVVIERQQGTDVSFSAPSSFTVTALAVGMMTPSSGPIGVAFTITGEHFGPFAGTNTRLLLGGTAVAVSVWNDTTITGTVPDLAAGSQPLWLERKSGTGVQSSATSYFLVTTPEVTSMVPSSAPIGAPFTLYGTSFGTYGGANTRVKFNGVVAPVSVWNDVLIVGTVPGAVSTGPAVLVVERAAGAGVSSSAEQAFEVLRPIISTVSPSYGPAGTVVSLTGHGFGPYAGTATQLLVGGTTVSVSVWNDATIRWTVTAAFSNGDYPLVVRRSPAGGTVDSEPASFTVGTGYGGASFGFSEPLSLAAQPDVNFEGGLNLPVDEGGRVETASKAAVEVPPNALEEDTEITLKRLRPDGLRTEAAGEDKKRAAGEAIEFGPAGTLFKTPVTIELPYDPALAGDEALLAVHYYDPLRRAWEELPSVVDRVRRVVRAQTAHFSIYQPMGALAPQTAAQDEFYFRDQYAFPNPSRGGAVTFRIQPGQADTVELRVYDLSGRRVHSSTDFTFRGAIDDLNGKGAQNTYDHVWGVSGVGSGVYNYVIKASRTGSSPIVKKGKVGVIK